MNKRLIYASAIAIGLLSPSAFARNSDCADYGQCDVSVVNDQRASSKPLAVKANGPKSGPDYIDETAQERNQRTSD